MCIKTIKKALLLFTLSFAIANLAVASDSIHNAGDSLQFVLPLASAGLTLYNKDTEGTIELSKSITTTMTITYLLKYSINEQRPDGGNYSFPSGHTSLAFSSAEFLRKRYGWNFGAPAYIAAAFVGYSRVESKEHYSHDVLAGAVIGIVSSHFFTTPFQKSQISLSGDSRNIELTIVRYF